MRARSTLTHKLQEFLAGERVDPRPAQGLFLIPVALELLLYLLTGEGVNGFFASGLVVITVPTAAAAAIGTGRLSRQWTFALPVLDLVGIAVIRQGADTAIGAAVVLPAIWLGLQFGTRGVWVTVVTVLTCFVVPSLVRLGPTVAALSHVGQLTVMTLMASMVPAGAAGLFREQAASMGANAERWRGAVRALIDQRRLTEGIVASVDVGLVALDAEGNYISTNPRQDEFMALAFPDGHHGVAGQDGYVYAADGTTLLGREDMPTVRAMRGEQLRDYLIWAGRDPAARRALAVSSTPSYDDAGVLMGAVLAYHDITELLVASRIKEEFVASVSHELRTPLTSIMGYVDIILDDSDGLPDDVRHYLTTVQRNARRLRRLVDDLLSTALQSTAATLEVEQVSVTQVLQLTALEAAKAAAKAGLTFTVEDPGAGEDLTVQGDSERLAQVFDNLFSNAIKYTPAGGHVEGGLRREGQEALIWVRDTGRGIAADEVDEVFAKFFRSQAVVTEAIPGVGLGLAITKTIVDAHGGTIGVRSAPGQGSVFEVRLPLDQPPAPVPERTSGAA